VPVLCKRQNIHPGARKIGNNEFAPCACQAAYKTPMLMEHTICRHKPVRQIPVFRQSHREEDVFAFAQQRWMRTIKPMSNSISSSDSPQRSSQPKMYKQPKTATAIDKPEQMQRGTVCAKVNGTTTKTCGPMRPPRCRSRSPQAMRNMPASSTCKQEREG
jgi:hypothetical protein